MRAAHHLLLMLLLSWGLAATAATDPVDWYFSRAAVEASQQQAESGTAEDKLRWAHALVLQGDEVDAASWLLQANADGNVEAQYLLGMCYLRGRGVGQDLDQAAYFLGKAVAAKDVPAQYQLGLLLSQAEFVDPGADQIDPAKLQRLHAKGEQLLRQAAAAGWAPAQYEVGLAAVEHGDAAAALRAFDAAADQGHVLAAFMALRLRLEQPKLADAAAVRAALLRLRQLTPPGSADARAAARLARQVTVN